MSDPNTAKTLLSVLEDRVIASPDQVGFFEEYAGSWRPVTYREFSRQVASLTRFLQEFGIESGDTVAVMGRPHLMWDLIDKAVMSLGAVVLGLDPHFSPKDWQELKKALPVKAVLFETHPIFFEVGTKSFLKDILWLSWTELEKKRHLTPPNVEDVLSQIPKPSSPATIMLTSGTTGPAKAIPFTHEQLFTACQAAKEALQPYSENETCPSTISWLPMHNATGRLITNVSIALGVAQYYLSDPTQIMSAIKQTNPQYLFAPPRLFEKISLSVQEKLREAPLLKRLFLKILKQISFSKTLRPFTQKPLNPLRHALFGTNMKLLLSGSAPLRPDVVDFFSFIHLPIYECFGMTEIAALVTINTPHQYRPGSVGKILPCHEYRLAEDQELLIKGSTVFKGYVGAQNEDLFTDDGYYKTGDIAEIHEGFVYLKGRKKEIIKTSTGLRVSPLELENHYLQIPGVEQFIVIGNNRKHLTALIAMSDSWKTHSLDTNDYVTKQLAYFGQSLPKKLRINRFYPLQKPLGIEEGHLTPSLKLRRQKIEEDFAREIDSLYKSA